MQAFGRRISASGTKLHGVLSRATTSTNLRDLQSQRNPTADSSTTNESNGTPVGGSVVVRPPTSPAQRRLNAGSGSAGGSLRGPSGPAPTEDIYKPTGEGRQRRPSISMFTDRQNVNAMVDLPLATADHVAPLESKSPGAVRAGGPADISPTKPTETNSSSTSTLFVTPPPVSNKQPVVTGDPAKDKKRAFESRGD
jgi:hypothetical protein